MKDDEIEDFLWYTQVGRPAVHDRFIVIILLAIQTEAVSVNSEVRDDNFVVPFFDDRCVQHITFVQVVVNFTKYLYITWKFSNKFHIICGLVPYNFVMARAFFRTHAMQQWSVECAWNVPRDNFSIRDKLLIFVPVKKGQNINSKCIECFLLYYRKIIIMEHWCANQQCCTCARKNLLVPPLTSSERIVWHPNTKYRQPIK